MAMGGLFTQRHGERKGRRRGVAQAAKPQRLHKALRWFAGWLLHNHGLFASPFPSLRLCAKQKKGPAIHKGRRGIDSKLL